MPGGSACTQVAVTETGGAPGERYVLTTTSVVRDDDGIRVMYEVVPPLADDIFGTVAVAEEDLGNRYDDGGGAYGLSPDGRSRGCDGGFVRSAGGTTLR
jgi:hypothetical protein